MEIKVSAFHQTDKRCARVEEHDNAFEDHLWKNSVLFYLNKILSVLGKLVKNVNFVKS